jgi:hypothetical protein
MLWTVGRDLRTPPWSEGDIVFAAGFGDPALQILYLWTWPRSDPDAKE